MMPVIRISDDVFSRLQRHAIPLVDSLDDVISRVLDQFEQSKEASATPKSGQTAYRSFGDLWTAVGQAFNRTGAEFRASERPRRSYWKPLRVGIPKVHYEWAVRRDMRSLDVCLHFETKDLNTNLERLKKVAAHKDEIRRGIDREFEAAPWGRRWAQIMFRIPYAGDLPNDENVREAATLMKTLIERTWPIIKEFRATNGVDTDQDDE